jgi:hypothetical protein
MNLQEIRKKYPQYGDLDDRALAGKLHQKFYSDMPFEDFAGKVGLPLEPAQPAPTIVDRAIDAVVNAPPLVQIPRGGLPPVAEWPQMTEGLPGPQPGAPLAAPVQEAPAALPPITDWPQMLEGLPGPQPGAPLAPAVPETLASLHRPAQPAMQPIPAHGAKPKHAVEDLSNAAADMLGAMLGTGAAGAAGLGAAVAGQPLPKIAQTAQEAAQYFQAPPAKDEFGRTVEPGPIGNAIAWPFKMLSEGGDKLTRWLYEQTGSPFWSALLGTGPELLTAALPFLGRLRRGPGKALEPIESSPEFAEGLSEGARLRKLAKDDPAAFRSAFDEALQKRMPSEPPAPEAPGEAIVPKPPDTPPPVRPQPGGAAVAPAEALAREFETARTTGSWPVKESGTLGDFVPQVPAETPGGTPGFHEAAPQAAEAPAAPEAKGVEAIQAAVNADPRLNGMVRVDAVGEEGTTIPPGKAQITIIGEHPANGGSFTVDPSPDQIAARLDEEAQRWAKPAASVPKADPVQAAVPQASEPTQPANKSFTESEPGDVVGASDPKLVLARRVPTRREANRIAQAQGGKVILDALSGGKQTWAVWRDAHDTEATPMESKPAEAGTEPTTPEIRQGDIVEYKGRRWQVGFVNQNRFKGTVRLQSGAGADAEQINRVPIAELRVVPKAPPAYEEIEVSVKYHTSDGRTVTVKAKASEALKEIDEQTERMKALQKCLES